MTSDDKKSTRLWASVHGELTTAEQAELDRDLATDSELHVEYTRIRSTHAHLSELIPLPQQHEDKRVDQILSAWEADSTAEIAAAPKTPSHSRGQLIRFPWRSALALAASVVLMVGILQYRVRPIAWDIQVAPLAYRGGTEQSQYSHSDLRTIAQRLKRTIEDTYEQRRAAGLPQEGADTPKRWRLSLQVQELPEGALAVEVESMAPAQRPPWSRIIEPDARLEGELDDFAQRIADDMAATQSALP